MEKGEIYKVIKHHLSNYPKGSYKHYFIYWNENDGYIEGIMLTSSDNPIYNNIKLKEEHIESGYDFKYGKSDENTVTLIAPYCLTKTVNKEHLKLHGKLSHSGIEFINSITDKLKHISWDEIDA